MTSVVRPNDPARERDFYLRLLDLVSADDPQPLLSAALAAIVDATGAQMVYLELREPDDGRALYWKAHGCSDVDVAAIRTSISRGIIAHALERGEIVTTPSASEDPAFRDQES